MALTALEFFSGIGSFAEASYSLRFSPDSEPSEYASRIEILAAYDQNTYANAVYALNFGLVPTTANLDSITLRQIPDADIWWMSPPCTPYSVRGKRADIADPRAKSFLQLLRHLEVRHPRIVFLENVRGFQNSHGHQLLLETLSKAGYSYIEVQLCATNFGTPMRRPRHFVIASFNHELIGLTSELSSPNDSGVARPLKEFLDSNYSSSLILPHEQFEKYQDCINVVDPFDVDTEAVCICFTKGYYRCRLASGSMIRLNDGRVRRFSSREMLRLFGFSDRFRFPEEMSEERAAGLLGNAVDVRTIRHILRVILSPRLCKESRPA
ncbi:MAG TPA: DNA cytosine methyltransferase [Oculatellaceae cyanobacterium]